MKKLTLTLVALALMVVPGCTLSTDFDGYFTADAGDGELDGGSRDGGDPMDGDVDDGGEDASRDGGDPMDGAPLDAPPGHVLTVVREGEGGATIVSSDGAIDCGATCSATYTPGTMVTLTVVPDENAEFVGWSEPGCDDGSLSCELTMDMARTVSVVLNIKQLRLTVTLSGDGSGGVTSSDGSITCDGSESARCSTALTYGAEITLTATPTGTSVFAGWSGGGCSGTGPCTLTLTADTTIGAAFDRDMRSLSVTRAGSGSGSVTSVPAGIDCGVDCSEAYPAGTTVTLTATASSDSTFAGWSGACSGTGTCETTMDAARTVTATFTLRRYTLEVDRGGTGTGTVISSNPLGLLNCGATCSAEVDHGTVVQLQATAGVGSTFGGWSGGGCDPATPLCLVTVTGDTAITANFSRDQHTVSVSYDSSGDGSGTVTSAPAGVSCATGAATGCVGTFDYGTMVTLTASPAVGSEFVQWSGACAGTADTCQVTTTADRAVTAELRRRRYAVTVSKTGAGMGTVSGGGISCGSTCSSMAAHGDTIALTASASAGSTFAGWGGACASAGAASTCTISITEVTNVTASFTLGTNVLSVTRVGNGTVLSIPPGIDCGSTCGASFTTNEVITLTATPALGYTFQGWTGACSGTAECTVTMGATPIAVTATFVPMRFPLSVSRLGSGMGGVSSAPSGILCPPVATCGAEFDYGTMVTLTATPAAGSTFTGWGGAPAGTCTTTGPCTVTMTEARAIAATFTLNTYQLDVLRAGGGTGSVASSPGGITCGNDCSQVYGHGSMIRLMATPSASSYFAGWTGGCSGTDATCDVTLTAATTVRATFELNRYPLNVMKMGMGLVAATDNSLHCGSTCSAEYVHGSSVTLTAAPDTGFRFAGWTGGGCTGTGDCVVSMTQVQNVTARFVRQVTVTVVPSASVGGRDPVVTSDVGGIRCFANGMSTGCSGIIDAGSSITLTASPPGWARFGGWTSGGCTGTGPCTLAPTTNVSVGAQLTQLGNVVFVTSSTHTGDLGGLSGADSICTALAQNAGLPNTTYRAWLSTLSVDAGSTGRGITSRNGFVRPDGLPVAYMGGDLALGEIRHPILLDENGMPVPMPDLVWTGTTPQGMSGSAFGGTCNDWTASAATMSTIGGHVERGGGEWTAAVMGGTAMSCSQSRRLYCFGTGGSFNLPRPSAPGSNAGFVFVSSRTFNGGAGLAAMDEACADEASSAGLPASDQYIAFVSAPGQSAASRVSFAGPFYRPDGFLVGDANQVLGGSPRLQTFITQMANGGFIMARTGWAPYYVWTGFVAGSPGGTPSFPATCMGWSAATSSATGQRGVPAAVGYGRWGQAESAGPFCVDSYPVYCIRGQ